MTRKLILAALGAAALALPGAASAQSWYGQPQYPQGQLYAQGYGYPRGDYDARQYRRFPGYPEFRGLENHIRGEIQDGMRQDLIQPDDARDLFRQLRDIQGWESREFRIHGWNLPDDDRYQLRSRLEQLDQLVDQIRAEPEG